MTMGSSRLCYYMSILFLIIIISQLYLTHSFSSALPKCHEDDTSALLQFKASLVIDRCVSGDTFSHPKLVSWKLINGENYSNSDCCSWDGVECDEDTSHVVGLHLSSSCLHGSINSSSSLFRFAHLQTLDLANNHFNYSPIPSELGHLSRLTNLNLSQSSFRGQIPSAISKLSKLSSLDLSLNIDSDSGESLLELKNPNLRSLVQNLTSLKQLSLSSVSISTVPEIMANLSSLTTLLLGDCGLYGEFPSRIFHLPNLQYVRLQDNEHLKGYFPEFYSSSPLKVLNLSGTSFSGELPISIGNLGSLTEMILRNCQFSGPIPPSLGNLTHLIKLELSYNSFTGHIQPSLGNLTQLTRLTLGYNSLQGQIPSSFSQLKNLEIISVAGNNLNGTVRIDMFHTFKRLSILALSFNSLSLLTESSSNVSTGLAQLRILELSSCNLTEFPEFLRGQHKLSWLELTGNHIQGLIPKWVCNISTESMQALLLNRNSLTGFQQTPAVLPWFNLEVFDIDNNKFRGPIPIPPPSIRVYQASTNMLTGETTPHICKMSLLSILDLSSNNLSGMLPPCLGNLSSTLQVLKLKGNNFHGTVPLTCTETSRLRMIDLSQNQLQGELPRSLANCTMLEFLNIGSNQIKDTFPSWMAVLPNLKVLVLHFNQFYGAVETNYTFPNLRIIDLSHNCLSGNLSSTYLQQLNAMTITDDDAELQYLQVRVQGDGWFTPFHFSMNITNKGTKMAYDNVQSFFKIMDLSSNRFEGDIPESIGNLKGLNLFNLSNNALRGRIPSSLSNLKKLETLDLSRNNLSGEIPPQLATLTFLGSFSVSHNNLRGPIPTGTQFSTFSYRSFEGNPGLCGMPLPNKCGLVFDTVPPLPSTSEKNGVESLFEFGWRIVLVGYGFGFVLGVVVGNVMISKRHDWFMKTFGRIIRT